MKILKKKKRIKNTLKKIPYKDTEYFNKNNEQKKDKRFF